MWEPHKCGSRFSGDGAQCQFKHPRASREPTTLPALEADTTPECAPRTPQPPPSPGTCARTSRSRHAVHVTHRPSRAVQGTSQRAGVFTTLSRSLFGLQPVPVARLCHQVFVPDVLEHVRMTADHLVADTRDDVAKREMPGFLGHTGMKHHLQQQVAQL